MTTKNETTPEQKIQGYDQAIENVQNWTPANPPSDPAAQQTIEAWKERKVNQISAAKQRAQAELALKAAGLDPSKFLKPKQTSKAKSSDSKAAGAVAEKKGPKIGQVVDVKSLGVIANKQLTIRMNDQATATIEKGTKLNISFVGLTPEGLVFKAKGEKLSGTITLNSGVVDKAMRAAFTPATAYYDISSVLPGAIRHELCPLTLRVIKRSPDEEQYLATVQSLASRVAKKPSKAS